MPDKPMSEYERIGSADSFAVCRRENAIIRFSSKQQQEEAIWLNAEAPMWQCRESRDLRASCCCRPLVRLSFRDASSS